MFLPGHFYLFDIIEDSLEFIEANIADMIFVMEPKVLLNLIVLVQSQMRLFYSFQEKLVLLFVL